MPIQRPWLAEFNQHGIPAQIQMPDQDQSLIDLFEQSFQQFSDQTAFISFQRQLSFKELDQLSLQFASYLQSLDLAPQSRIAVMMPNILQYAIVTAGILRAGFIQVNVNPLYTSRELAYQLKDSGAEVLVIVDNALAVYQPIQHETVVKTVVRTSIIDFLDDVTLKHIPALQAFAQTPEHQVEHVIALKTCLAQADISTYQRPHLTLSDIALLQYTGGTTGISKGTILSHQNLYANVLQAEAFFVPRLGSYEMRQEDKMFCALPLYHIFAFTVTLLLGAYLGITTVLVLNPRDIEMVIALWKQNRPTFFPAVNTLFNALANHPAFKQLDFSNFKLAVGGGMPVLKATADLWQQATGSVIVEAYGLSETSPMATSNPATATHFNGKIGLAAPSTDIAILDDDGNELPFGEAGEICIRGPQVMQGYWQRPDETAQVMTADGFFRSGDIGTMDENGYVELVDRKKDMILVSGFNVYPREIEEVIAQHPKVLEVAAVGILDEKSGEAPKIFVVKRDESLTEEEIMRFAHENLAAYKCPKAIEFIQEVPKSNVGKILRKDLKVS